MKYNQPKSSVYTVTPKPARMCYHQYCCKDGCCGYLRYIYDLMYLSLCILVFGSALSKFPITCKLSLATLYISICQLNVTVHSSDEMDCSAGKLMP